MVAVIVAWWHMTQGNLCIGVALSIVGLAMVTNSIEGHKMRMTVTVHRAAACVFGISCTLAIAVVKWSYHLFAVFHFQHHALFIVIWQNSERFSLEKVGESAEAVDNYFQELDFRF